MICEIKKCWTVVNKIDNLVVKFENGNYFWLIAENDVLGCFGAEYCFKRRKKLRIEKISTFNKKRHGGAEYIVRPLKHKSEFLGGSSAYYFLVKMESKRYNEMKLMITADRI